MALSLEGIERLFAERGPEQYTGEPITQLEHALQTAMLAERAGADDELVTAALLHDLGHLLHALSGTPTLQGVDDGHQFRALPFLRGAFGDGVLDPIRLHVAAKRYLCSVRPGYEKSLSDDSRRSLALQGGIFSAPQAQAFIKRPGATRAVQLRLWDDGAKVADLPTPPLSHFIERARLCMLAPEAGPA